ncbi:MAG: sugar ABC transporter ATP-binding protein [Clostridiales bacterium]|nr:sugar ABC transporter ATP-binding protein [Clostridiales bacterium]
MALLQMKGITKSFFGVKVLDQVDLQVEPGEVHALLGENGAGKSTLMNILAGVYTRDAGQVFFMGKPLEDTTVRSAESAGIAFVHQELNLFNDLRVYENIFLRKELVKVLGVLDKKEMIRRTRDLMNSLGVDIHPAAMVSELDTSKKQLLEIAKALHANAELIILDEPTTSLNNDEIDLLFSLINRLKEAGKSFIFISHKMQEVFRIADRYTVLRNGLLIDTGSIKDVTSTTLARLMVGNQYTDQSVYQPRELGEVVLEMKNLSGEGFRDVSLSVKKGEIIGFTGLKGAGISELFRTIFGVLPITGGELVLFGEPVLHNSVRTAMRKRLSMIAANRKENSIIPDFSLLENFYVSEHRLSSRKPLVRINRELNRYRVHRDTLSIRASTAHAPITSLSGGNQQKVIIARWLNTQADILLLDNPTQGIDVGGKAEIYGLIQQLAHAGKTILVNTLEIPEIMKVADRCVVFYHGRIHSILSRGDISEESVMIAATNAIKSEVHA